MLKLIAMLLALALCSATALGEAEASAAANEPVEAPGAGIDPDAAALPDAAAITAEPDEPALKNPGERYEYYTEESDGSETVMYVMLDAANDEAADIADHGALFITENQLLNDEGAPAMKVEMALQDSPYGTVMISSMRFLWVDQSTYSIGTHTWSWDGSRVEAVEGFEQEAFDFFIESYHFPYGSLETLNGVRQDGNGYTYFLISSDGGRRFEFVTGTGMRIVQLRVYTDDKDGTPVLTSYVDYDTGAALEIPQPVLDAMGEVLSPVAEAPRNEDTAAREARREANIDQQTEEEPET